MAENHHIWEITGKKPKKRFGRLIRSQHDDIQEMLAYHKERVTEVILNMTAGWSAPKGTPSSSEDELSPNRMDIAGSLRSPLRFPPIGNFAPSPRRRASPGKG